MIGLFFSLWFQYLFKVEVRERASGKVVKKLTFVIHCACGCYTQIGYVEMVMPNIHYFTVNMAPFGMSNKDEVNNKLYKFSTLQPLSIEK